jgi:hypothetical protein
MMRVSVWRGVHIQNNNFPSLFPLPGGQAVASLFRPREEEGETCHTILIIG